jgi:hypothetical protein
MARALRAKRYTKGYYRLTQRVVTSDSAVDRQEFGSESFPRDQQTPEAIAAIGKAGVEKWVADHESGREQSGVKRAGKKWGDRQRVRAIFETLGMY